MNFIPKLYAPPSRHPAGFSFSRFMDASHMPKLSFSDFTGSFSYFGPDDISLADHATDFCKNTARITGDVQPAISALLAHIRAQHPHPSHTTLWLSVRVSKPSNHFDWPHWHMDGCYSTPVPLPELTDWSAFISAPIFPPPIHKYGAVLAGPATLFLDDGPRMARETARRILNWDITSRLREADVKAYRPRPLPLNTIPEEWAQYVWHRSRESIAFQLSKVPVAQAPSGEVARWVVGDSIRGGLHSEPPLTSWRLIITVLPGTESQTRELCEKWGEEYGKIDTRGQPGEDICVEYARVSCTHPLGY